QAQVRPITWRSTTACVRWSLRCEGSAPPKRSTSPIRSSPIRTACRTRSSARAPPLRTSCSPLQAAWPHVNEEHMSVVTTTIVAAAEDVRSADAVALISELSAELAALYETTDGSAGFKPEDVEVPRAAFVIARI